jgi:hypothetical protein
VGAHGSAFASCLWLLGVTRPRLEPAGEPLVLPDGHLHSSTDAICPRCLSWIEDRDYVRLTAYGLLQHEVCP